MKLETLRLCLPAQLPLHPLLLTPHQSAWRSHALMLTSLTNRTQRYLNSFTWGSNSLSTQKGAIRCFRQGTLASDLEVLTLSPVASLCAEGYGLIKPTQPHHLPRAGKLFWGPQTVVQRSNLDSSRAPSFEGLLANWEESLGKTLNMLDRLYISSGLGEPWNPSGGAGKHGWGEEWQDFHWWMDGWMDFSFLSPGF